MGIRFRKSVKLAPGIRMNFSGSGLSWTVGPRGASMNFGKRGTYFNTGIPGTGLYARERVGGPAAAPQRAGRQMTTLSIAITVQDDGKVVFKDLDGNLLPDKLVQPCKKAAVRGHPWPRRTGLRQSERTD